MPTSRTRTPRSSSADHVACASARCAEEHEVGVARHRVEPRRGQTVDDPVALLLDGADGLEHEVGVREGGERDRLGRRRQVVRHPHEAQRVDERRVGREVAEAAARERERLAHRPRHDEARPALEQRQRARRAGAGELGVRLVDDDEGPSAPRRAPPRRRRGRAPCPWGCWASRGRRRAGGGGAPARPRMPRRGRTPPRPPRRASRRPTSCRSSS